MPRKISVRDAEVQQLSPALGSETVVAVVSLGLEALAAVALVTVVFRQEDLSKKSIGN